MVTEAFMRPFMALFGWLIDLLPEHEFEVPAMDGVVARITEINSLIPIGPVLQMAVALLSLLSIFLTIRLVLVIRHVVLP